MKKILFVLTLFFTHFAFASPLEDYAAVLAKIVKPQGIQWEELTAVEKTKLGNYLQSVSGQNASDLSTPQDRLAFWLNAHNACVMKMISDHLPLNDVMKISGFRDKLTCKIDGQERTLIDIQSGVIRPTFKDPRVHFALWWGTKGGPSLPKTPYDGKKLDTQLNEQIEDALSNRKFVDFSTKTAMLSPIFDWFRTDFGPEQNAPLSFIKEKIPKEKVAKLPKKMETAKFLVFDWSLDRI